MISSSFEEDNKNTTKISQSDPPKRRKNKNKKKKNKSKQNHPQHGVKKDFYRRRNFRLSSGMASLAENLSVAATWQLKHQLAYWKAKAKALEYENRVLHNIIKKSFVQSSSQSSTVRSETEMEEEESSSEDDVDKAGVEDENFEVSEEFIEFLRANAKYKEDARLERERFKAKQKAEDEREIRQMEAGPSAPVDPTVELKELYGNRWQRISTLETYLSSEFIKKCDNTNPLYWPNIPFNFNFGM